MNSALREQSSYDDELSAFRGLRDKLDATIGPGLRSRVGGDFEAQQQARHKALATIAQAGAPVAVLGQCRKRFG